MIACAEAKKPFVVFDRPNPAGSHIAEGNILDLTCRSFIGYYPIIQRHGMTMSELAKLFNDEYKIGCELITINMEGYKRNMYYEDTKKLWVMPSPNFPTPLTAIVYNATCIFEGTNVSEGRGTTAPFQYVGAPYINGEDYAKKLNALGLKGVYFRPIAFTPVTSKNANSLCEGVEVHVLDREKFAAVKTGWAMLDVVRKLYPNEFSINAPYKEGAKCMLELNTGCSYIKENKYTLAEQFEIIDRDTAEFIKTRSKYLIY
jgi:uncharacterized protein YbbC (DUF1343 family)